MEASDQPPALWHGPIFYSTSFLLGLLTEAFGKSENMHKHPVKQEVGMYTADLAS
jgi:hypothetical protein